MTDISKSVSFKDISIERKLPIINGFVQPPDGQLTQRNSLTIEDAEIAVPGSFTRPISGNLRTDREWYILPAFNSLVGPPDDFFADLRAAADA